MIKYLEARFTTFQENTSLEIIETCAKRFVPDPRLFLQGANHRADLSSQEVMDHSEL